MTGDAGRSAAAADISRTRWDYGDHPNQYAELFRPPAGSASGVVVLLHGGFWRSVYYADQTVPLALDLAARGFAAWNLEYRGVGDGGGWPTTFDDVAAGIDLLTTVGDLDLSAVVVAGHSAGGQLAIWSAARAGLPSGSSGARPAVTPTGAISLAGVLDLTTAAQAGLGGTPTVDLLGGGPAGVPDRYELADPMRRLPLGVRTVAVHARDDDIVPFSYSETYVAAATAAGDRCELIEVGGGHFDVVDAGSDAWRSVVTAVSRLMGS